MIAKSILKELLEAKPFNEIEIYLNDGRSAQVIADPAIVSFDDDVMIVDEETQFSIIPLSSMSYVNVHTSRGEYLVDRWRRTGSSPEDAG